MFQKIFTNKQLSIFFQAAIIINIIGLFLDTITYHYFPQNNLLKFTANNLGTLSITIIALIIISQIILLFRKNNPILVTQYKLTALSIQIFIGIFLFWLLNIDNTIQEQFIIFISNDSRTDHSIQLIVILITVFTLMFIDLSQTIKKPESINETETPQIIRDVIQHVLRKYFLIFLTIFGIIHVKKFEKFAYTMLYETEISALFDLKILEFIVPVCWLFTLGCYMYYKRKNQTTSLK